MKKLFIIFAALCLAVPAMAADWDFYGSARFKTFYTTDSVEGRDDVNDLIWTQQGNSRIGARVKVNDQIGGRFEYGSGPNLRLLYGTYNFNGGQLLIGQNYTPTELFYSNSVYGDDGNLLGTGGFYQSRLPMIQLKFGGFKLAFVTPSTAFATASTSIERTLPKVEAAYKFKTDMFFVDVFAGYNTFDAKGTSAGDESIDSYLAGLGGGVNFGPGYFKANVHMGQNIGNYGGYNPMAMTDEVNITGTTVTDNNAFGYLAVLGFKASDMFTIEVGGSGIAYDPDMTGTEEDTTYQYYLNTVITFAPGFFIVPEVGFIDRDKGTAGQDQGDITYLGLKWQINF